MYEIMDITNSPLAKKKFRVYLNNNSYYDFGLKNSNTFVDHKDKTIKENYHLRHLASRTENYLIKNLIPSPALFSYYLLWGRYTNLYKNIDYLNKLFNQRYR